MTYRWLLVGGLLLLLARLSGAATIIQPPPGAGGGGGGPTNYIADTTAGGGLTETGGPAGSSVGMMDCAANQILQRNAGDTDWVCTSAGVAITDYVSGVLATQGLIESGGPAGSSVGLMDCAAGQVLQRNVTDTGWECGALPTDVTNYVAGVTTNQGLTETGGPDGSTVGLIDCAAGELLQRNAADTAWVCSAVPARGVYTSRPTTPSNGDLYTVTDASGPGVCGGGGDGTYIVRCYWNATTVAWEAEPETMQQVFTRGPGSTGGYLTLVPDGRRFCIQPERQTLGETAPRMCWYGDAGVVYQQWFFGADASLTEMQCSPLHIPLAASLPVTYNNGVGGTGTAGEITNTGGTLTYSGIFANLDHMTTGTDVQGDLYYRGTGTSLARLATGTAGQCLRTEGASANPTWGYPANLAIASQVQGDIPYSTGTAWVRLAPAPAGQLRRTDGAAAKPT